jgi:hypothetical protein
MLKKLVSLGALLFVIGCSGGGGGGGSSSSSSTGGSGGSSTPPVTLTNFASVVVDQGPAALNTGPNGYTTNNVAFVSVTICAPGSTTNCQTIDHIQVDTGSIGLRIFNSVVNSSVKNALPLETDASSNPVGECYQYVDGYVFGSVRTADMTIGGETVSGIPFQLLSDTGQFGTAPSSCSGGGGTDLGTVQNFGANGIIGIGTTPTDCGSVCASGGQSAAIYYDCPSSGCSTVIARSSSATAPFQQLPNPVAAMGVDNNGTILVLPAISSAGSPSLTGTLYFGIGTQTNNGIGSATIYTVSSSTDADGPGLITINYKGQTLPNSFVDSGSSAYFFEDSTIALCSSADFNGFYCPASDLTLSPVINGRNGASYTDTFTLYNAMTKFNTSAGFAAIPGIGANPNIIFPSTAYAGSFDLGLPFFYGRSVYTAIEGRPAGGTLGPYVAF